MSRKTWIGIAGAHQARPTSMKTPRYSVQRQHEISHATLHQMRTIALLTRDRCHFDIKPNNILLRSSDIVVVRRLSADDAFVSKVGRLITRISFVPLHVFVQAELASVELMIIDLGESAVVPLGGRQGRVGANCYRAPEVTLGRCSLSSRDGWR